MLNFIRDNVGARKDRTRVGRGIGSGKGKTCGRGVKGQKARSGVSIKGFEGGQMPLYQRLPKRGFNSRKDRKTISIINLSEIQSLVDAGKVDAKKTLTLDVLQKLGCVSLKTKELRILGSGDIKAAFSVEAHHITSSAKEKIEKAKGSVKLLNSSNEKG